MREKIEALLSGNEEARRFFLEEIKKVALQSKVEHFLRTRLGDDYAEEVLSDLILKFIIMREVLLKKERITRSYVRKVIRSCLVDTVNREGKISTVSINNPVNPHEEGWVESFEDLLGKEEDKDLRIQAEELFDVIMSLLSEKDKDTLCYYLNTEIYDRNVEVKGMSKDALYKRWERLKKKIREKLTFVPTEEEFRIFAERFLSEVCAERGYK
ncbi:MAG: hypothetical protein Q9N26_08175 [Aquificota bacterium]|nr:hypothetical protein [Aquificota bacterium]